VKPTTNLCVVGFFILIERGEGMVYQVNYRATKGMSEKIKGCYLLSAGCKEEARDEFLLLFEVRGYDVLDFDIFEI
jgi:hypothetical protein